MTDPVSDRWDDEHAIDRAGRVWLLVRDGGMATRATFTGIISIGIAALEAEAGPLTRVTTRQISAAATMADAGSPSAGAETCAACSPISTRCLWPTNCLAAPSPEDTVQPDGQRLLAQAVMNDADDRDLEHAIREWAAPDDDLGWTGSEEVAEHAAELAAFLCERGWERRR